MKKVILSILAVLVTACPAVTRAESPAPPVVAFDILKADIDRPSHGRTLPKNSPPAIDRQIRVVDKGQYNLGVGIVHRGPANDKPGDPITGPHHDYTAETYIILLASSRRGVQCSIRSPAALSTS
jgi:hypothetical protein